MVFTAVLQTITQVKSVSEEIMPFIHFKAKLDGRDYSDEDTVAVLLISGTASYYIVFLDEGASLSAIEKDLAEQEAELHPESRKTLMQHLNA